MANVLDAEKKCCKCNGENTRASNSKEFRKVNGTLNRVTYITNMDFDNVQKERPQKDYLSVKYVWNQLK